MIYSNTQVLVDNQAKSSLDRKSGFNIYSIMRELMDFKFILKLRNLTMKQLLKIKKSLNKRLEIIDISHIYMCF